MTRQRVILNFYLIIQINNILNQSYHFKLVNEACADALKWLDANQTAEKEEYEHKLKELEKLCAPIMTKMYQGGAGEESGKTGPKVEEVD